DVYKRQGEYDSFINLYKKGISPTLIRGKLEASVSNLLGSDFQLSTNIDIRDVISLKDLSINGKDIGLEGNSLLSSEFLVKDLYMQGHMQENSNAITIESQDIITRKKHILKTQIELDRLLIKGHLLKDIIANLELDWNEKSLHIDVDGSFHNKKFVINAKMDKRGMPFFIFSSAFGKIDGKLENFYNPTIDSNFTIPQIERMPIVLLNENRVHGALNGNINYTDGQLSASVIANNLTHLQTHINSLAIDFTYGKDWKIKKSKSRASSIFYNGISIQDLLLDTEQNQFAIYAKNRETEILEITGSYDFDSERDFTIELNKCAGYLLEHPIPVSYTH
ncbi:MAG: hypothetical protein MPK62_14720, partial [Alphaproteobacteria bacterium]|nr:hypothetical protein [Alphaproteobacteria bacterium]